MSGPLQLPLDLTPRPAFGAEDFLVAPCNAEALAWIEAWPAWPTHCFGVHGPEASGKTHLAHVWQVRSGATAVAASDLRVASVGDLVDEAGRLVLDGLDGPLDEEAMLHLYNLVGERGGWLLMTARTPLARRAWGLPDLASRLSAAPAVGIGAPDDQLLSALLAKLFADRQLRVAPDVIAYLLPRMERSFAAARHLVAALDAASLEKRRNITTRLAGDVLSGLAK